METQEDRDQLKREQRKQAVFHTIGVGLFALVMGAGWVWLIYQFIEIIRLTAVYMNWRY